MVNLALIGYGYWGPNLLRNLFEGSNCNVLYCCDRDIDQLQKAKKRYPSISITTDPEQIFSDNQVQAIILATPTKTHFPLAKRAIENGKDVLIEKPMTMSFEEADGLVSLAKKLGRIIMVDHTFLFNDAILKIKKLMDGGELGDIIYIDSVRANLGLFQKDVNVIFDLASHDISIIQYLLGTNPLSVSAFGQSHFGSQEDVAYITVNYPKKIFAHVHVSWLSPVKVRRMFIVGTKKMIVYDDTESAEKVRLYDKGVVYEDVLAKDIEQIKIGYRSGDVWLPKVEIIEPLGVLINEFVKSIDKREARVSSGQFGSEVMRILESATISCRRNKKVRL